MKRREFITFIGSAAAAWPLAARAQQTAKMPRIGILFPGPSERHTASLDAFRQGLHDLGYTEGQNIAIERRYGEWKLDRLPELAAELVRLKVDVIVAWSTPPARRRSTIPRRSANRSLSTVEPVCGTPKWKLENGEQRLAPQSRRSRIKMLGFILPNRIQEEHLSEAI